MELLAGDIVTIKNTSSAIKHGVNGEKAIILSLEDPMGHKDSNIVSIKLLNENCSELASVFVCRGVNKAHFEKDKEN